MPNRRVAELIGPLRLASDIAASPLLVRDGVMDVPTGPGLGVELDEDRIAFLARQHDQPGHRTDRR